MYKLTPQYIVSYDQVNTCFLHVQRSERRGAEKEWEARGEVVIGGRGVGIFIGLFRGTSHPRVPYLSIMSSFGLN